MITKSYDFLTSPDNVAYFFISEGEQGKIPKMIFIESFGEGSDTYNLGFGDLRRDGKIDDSIVSNNHDIVKIIGTIAKVVYQYSNIYPLRRIRIEPVDEKRKRLYNHVFRRNYEDINAIFDITGIANNNKETYSPDKNYDIFELKRKFI